ncbi:MAG TPA: glutathione S-transferase [Gammaproteobacteria bacterium]|nr:glutathione S-transferase [Gammaproteobacteria bacterium]
MKLYDTESLPNPRRVRMFLAEKKLDLPREQVDVIAGQHRTPEFLARNPDGTVPLLELDDGSYISETVAISRYIEERHPQPALLGRGPEEKAVVEMWQRRVEHSLMNTLVAYFHHATDGFGEADRYRNREWGEHNRKMAIEAMQRLDRQLAKNEFVAGKTFSIADITALCAVDLAKALGIDIPAGCTHLGNWHARVSERPSAAA